LRATKYKKLKFEEVIFFKKKRNLNKKYYFKVGRGQPYVSIYFFI